MSFESSGTAIRFEGPISMILFPLIKLLWYFEQPTNISRESIVAKNEFGFITSPFK